MEETTDKFEEPASPPDNFQLSKEQNDIKSLLDGWYTHRVQLEAKLHGLAWQLDQWERGTNTATAVGAFTGIGAGATMVVGVIFPPLLLAGLALGGAAAATSITTSVVKEENIKKQVDAATALLEQDKQLTENFFDAVEKLKETKFEVAKNLGREELVPSSGNSLDGMLSAASAISSITSGSRSEMANRLRAVADQLRGEAEEVRRLLTEDLAVV